MPGGLVLGGLAVLLLWAASPPALFAGAELLVLPGWMAFYAAITGSRRPLLLAWLLGCCHVLWFSASLRHVVWGGWLAMGPAGGLYYLLAAAGTRALGRWVRGPLAFGIALAAVEWLRAHVPEVPYPHGQPIHALHTWPGLLAPVAWGGEALGNLLLAALAAAAVDLYRSWRLAHPPWRGARLRLAVLVGTWALLAALPLPHRAAATGSEVAVAAIEPGLGPMFQFRPDYLRLVQERLLQPTRELAGPAAADPPVLVLWPETSYPGGAVLGPQGPRLHAGGLGELGLAAGSQLLVGALVQRGDRLTPAALWLDASGRYLGHQEKLVLVPGGERIPFLDLLPESLARAVIAGIRRAMGQAPDFDPGTFRPPLPTAAGPVGVMLCYDNAFDSIAARHVDAGARLLVVLSNESWYRGGAERDQLAAATVMRALETGTPVVRCTVDGLTLAVGADGRRLGALPDRPASTSPPSRVLRLRLAPGPGALPPMAWLHGLLGPLLLGLLLLPFAHALYSWARLLAVRRSAGAATPPGGPRQPPLEGGS